MNYEYKNYSDALVETDRSKVLTEGKSLLEYSDLQSWQDEIDQIQTVADAYKIPQWVLDQLGITRSSIMPKKSPSARPANQLATSTGDYTDKEAAGKFWENAKNKMIDIDNFHKAFDDNLKDMKFDMSIFNSDGLLANQGTYGKIKNLDPDNNATKAIKKLWGLQFKEQGKLVGQVATANPADKTVDEAQFIKEVEELIFDVMPKVDNNTARSLIDQRKATGYRVTYSFKLYPTGKVIWSWYDDDYDWPQSSKFFVDLGYNPFTKSEAEVAADIMIAVENDEISKE